MTSSIQRMNSGDDMQDPGECVEHNRTFECYCDDCHVLICPGCLMFGSHKGHKVSQMDESSKDMRNRMDECGRNGLLKFEISENVLLDIRHTKLTCEEKKQKIIKDVESTFSLAINKLKQRKEQVLKEINEHFNSQIESIFEHEQRWVKKQEDSKELVDLARNQNDLQVIQKSHFIIETINSLKEPQEYQKVQLINTMNNNFQYAKFDIPNKEFLLGLDSFVQKGEIINMQYKC